jgi:hypothetical protein
VTTEAPFHRPFDPCDFGAFAVIETYSSAYSTFVGFDREAGNEADVRPFAVDTWLDETKEARVETKIKFLCVKMQHKSKF